MQRPLQANRCNDEKRLQSVFSHLIIWILGHLIYLPQGSHRSVNLQKFGWRTSEQLIWSFKDNKTLTFRLKWTERQWSEATFEPAVMVDFDDCSRLWVQTEVQWTTEVQPRPKEGVNNLPWLPLGYWLKPTLTFEMSVKPECVIDADGQAEH